MAAHKSITVSPNYFARKRTTTRSTTQNQLPLHILEDIIWRCWSSPSSAHQRIHLIKSLSLVNTTIRRCFEAAEARRVVIPHPSYVPILLAKFIRARRANNQSLGALGIAVDDGGMTNLKYDACHKLILHLDIGSALILDGDGDQLMCEYGYGCFAGRLHAAEMMISEAIHKFMCAIGRKNYLPNLETIEFEFVDMDTPRVVNTLTPLFIPMGVKQMRINVSQPRVYGDTRLTDMAKLSCCYRCAFDDVNYMSPQWVKDWGVYFGDINLDVEGREEEDVRALVMTFIECSQGSISIEDTVWYGLYEQQFREVERCDGASEYECLAEHVASHHLDDPYASLHDC